MKFDYETVQGAIDVINDQLTAIDGAIADRIVNVSYASGNAKEAIDSYIATLNNCLDPIRVNVGEMHAKLQEIKNTYFAAESSIKTKLGDNSNINIHKEVYTRDSIM